MNDPQARQKRTAAEAAVALVTDGMAVGLGTGSTAWFAIEALAARVRGGLTIEAIATSERSAEQARAGGIKVVTFAERRRLDVTIDGADEIARDSLALIKGHGGALLREKIVATASDRLVIVADERKWVDRLGETSAIPVEVVPFGWETTAVRIERLGGEPQLRLGADGAPYCTDGGNMILDCGFGAISDPVKLDRALSMVTGVIETGLFIGMASIVFVAGDSGVRRFDAAPTC
ncbi:MAG TPA: ribose-5-phosphate isomerase RpiA [Acetobacteraceae bacterium]|nr:ribose-5-phosphate isomerase RpiA [Acetobacteraceae bacterium]